MEPINIIMSAEIEAPPYPSSGDSIQMQWLMNRYGIGLSRLMMENICFHVAKDFQEFPSKIKILKFTLRCEEIDEN